MSVDHYENFPVASLALPAHLRRPVEVIYAFARGADDLADEGNAPQDERLAALQAYSTVLDEIEQGVAAESLSTSGFAELARVVREHDLPIQPLRDLLSAFRQDVSQTRYADFAEVMHYCRRSANPVGRMLLALYRHTDSRDLARADALCSSLQLINFLQDIAIDHAKGRIYLPQDELERAGLGGTSLNVLLGKSEFAATARGLGGIAIGTPRAILETRWRVFMLAQIERVRNMLQASAPLGLALHGRIGLETRMIIAGGDRILRKLYLDPLAPLSRRVKLNLWDWLVILTRAMLKQ